MRPVRHALLAPDEPGPSPEELVRRVADWPGLVCLRGDWADGGAILTSHPLEVVTGDIVEALDRLPAPVPAGADDPVGGGWFGTIAYDGTSRLTFHDHVVRRLDGRWWFEALWSAERDEVLQARRAAWATALRCHRPAPPWRLSDLTGPPVEDHLAAVERAVELIRAGELYQVNVCTRLHGRFGGSAAAFFADVSAALAPARAAFIAGDGGAIVSLGPELFLHQRGRAVRTAPIKGTLPRAAVPDGNDVRLRASVKDVAENVMIVDLMRNDLGRVCEPGGVRVTELLSVQAHPGVWHLVSAVEGRLRPGVGTAGLLGATFPPGSVTGAPKLRAIAAIADLESEARGVYTGAVGFVSPCRGAEFAVAIRTFEITGATVDLGVGGGVTADSVPMLEWRECLHKAAPLLRAAGVAGPVPPPERSGPGAALLETVLAVDGVPVRVADHLARLDRSCREVHGRGVPADLAARIRVAARGVPGRAVVRVVVAPGGAASVTVAVIGAPPGASDAVCVPRPDGLWRHKWADRSPFTAAEAGTGVPLFVADDGTVLETSRGNVFLVRPDGTLVTPPLRDDLLPGVTRRAVLDLARDEGIPTELRPFDVTELSAHAAFWTSSLSGAVAIRSVDGVALPRAGTVVSDLARQLLGVPRGR